MREMWKYLIFVHLSKSRAGKVQFPDYPNGNTCIFVYACSNNTHEYTSSAVTCSAVLVNSTCRINTSPKREISQANCTISFYCSDIFFSLHCCRFVDVFVVVVIVAVVGEWCIYWSKF